MNYKYYIFDLDGTIVDSEKSICLSINHTLKHFGHKELDFSITKKYIGTPLKQVLTNLSLDPEKAIDIYRPIYFELMKTHQHLYNNILELLNEIKNGGNLIFLATNKGRTGTDLTLEYTNIKNYFDLTVTETDVKNVKPEIDMFVHIKTYLDSKNLKYSNRDFLMVGDSPVDCDFATNCQIDFAHAGWGFYEMCDFMIKPKYRIKEVLDILKL